MKFKKQLLNQHKSTVSLLLATGCVLVTVIGADAETPSSPAAKNNATPGNAAPAAADAAKPATASWSLVEVLAYALDHNPQRKAAWFAAKSAQAGIGTAKADGGLQVGLNGTGANQWGFGPVGSFVPSGVSKTSATGWNETLAVDATYPVYTGGRVKANTKVAMYNYQAAVAQAVSTEQNLVFNTTLDYLDILRNQQLVDVSNANLAVAKESSRVANVRYNAGAAAKLEVLNAATVQATAQQSLVAAQNTLQQSYANLNTIMGRKPQTPLQIVPIEQLTLPQPLLATPSLNAPVSSAPATNAPVTNSTAGSAATSLPSSTAGTTASNNQAVTGNNSTGETASSMTGTANPAATANSQSLASGEQLAGLASTASPSLAVLEAQLQAGEASIDVAKSARKPSLGLSLTGLISNPVSYLGRFILSLGGSLAQTLFDSGRTTSEVRAAEATAEQLKSSLLEGELSVANQIEQSLLALNSAKEQEVSANTAVASAQEAMRAAQLGYSAGVQTALDVSTAEAALLTAQTNAVNARFDVAASQAQLAAAVGVLTDEGQQAYQQSIPLEKITDQKGK